ncbi:MAG: Uma2 family endonuclease [Cyanobacteriota bacterium]|nr:Uma2 family endonuclease [Cyanobacteriota bacterium]
MVGLTVKDLDKLTADYPDLRMELVSGEIIVRSLSGLESSEVTAEIIGRLSNWVRPRKLGRVIGSSGGFRLHGDVRSPDASFTLAEKLPRPTEDGSGKDVVTVRSNRFSDLSISIAKAITTNLILRLEHYL